MAASTFSGPILPPVIISKCDGGNYLIWASQIVPILRSNDLMNIVDRTEKSPEEFLSGDLDANGIEGPKKANPEFTSWYKKDQFCLSWINSTLSDRVLTHVFHLKSSAAVWDYLESKYGGKSKTKIFDLRRRLQTLTQGSRTCAEYLDFAKSIVAELRATGSGVSDDDLISYVAVGLHSQFDLFVANVNLLRDDKTMEFDKFERSLLSYASKLPTPITEVAAFYGYTRRGRTDTHSGRFPRDGVNNLTGQTGPGPNGGNNLTGQRWRENRNYTRPNNLTGPNFGQNRLENYNYFGPNSRPGPNAQDNRSVGPGNLGLGRGRQSMGLTRPNGPPFVPRNNNQNQGNGGDQFKHGVKCQICDRYYHTALDCYQIMNFAYQGRHSPSQLAAMAAQTNLNVDDSIWFVDSGANRHISNDSASLLQQEPYSGTDSVAVGNGTGQQDGADTAEGAQ